MSPFAIIVTIVIAVVLVAGFIAMIFAAMGSKRHTGHHGPRSGHADHKRGKRR